MTDPALRGLYASFGTRTPTTFPSQTSGEVFPLALQVVSPTNSAGAPWQDVNTVGASIQLSISLPGQTPVVASSAFTLATDGVTQNAVVLFGTNAMQAAFAAAPINTRELTFTLQIDVQFAGASGYQTIYSGPILVTRTSLNTLAGGTNVLTTANIGTTANTVAAGDDPRIVNAARVGVVTSAALTVQPGVNDYTQAGLATASVLRFNNARPSSYLDITGIQGGFPGRVLTIINVSASSDSYIYLRNEAASGGNSSQAANRLHTFSGNDVLISSGTLIDLIYDGNISRWRVRDLSSRNVDVSAATVQNAFNLVSSADETPVITTEDDGVGGTNVIYANHLPTFANPGAYRSALGISGGTSTFPFTGLAYSPSSGGTPVAATTDQVAGMLAGKDIAPAGISQSGNYQFNSTGAKEFQLDAMLRYLGPGNPLRLDSSFVFGWCPGNPNSTVPDTGLSRSSAGTLSIGNGTPGDVGGTINARHLVLVGGAADITLGGNNDYIGNSGSYGFLAVKASGGLGVISNITSATVFRADTSGNLTASGTVINFANLPTSDPHVAGDLWRNGTVVNISTG